VLSVEALNRRSRTLCNIYAWGFYAATAFKCAIAEKASDNHCRIWQTRI
jgi:hypothetical protein